MFQVVPIILALLLVTIFVSIVVWSEPEALFFALMSNEVMFAIKLSLLTSITAAAIALIVGIPTAYALSRYDFKGKHIIETILMIPFVMPPVALGAVLLVFFTNTLIGSVLDSLLNIVFEVPGIVVAQFAVIFPMVTKVLKTSFELIDIRYEAVARTLGYGRLKVLFKVLLPMCKSGLASAFILGFGRALGEFGASVTLAGATRFKTETLPIAIYLSLSSGDIPLTVALIIILIFIAFITLIALHWVGKKLFIMWVGT